MQQLKKRVSPRKCECRCVQLQLAADAREKRRGNMGGHGALTAGAEVYDNAWAMEDAADPLHRDAAGEKGGRDGATAAAPPGPPPE
jgi:hypothetical protein